MDIAAEWQGADGRPLWLRPLCVSRRLGFERLRRLDSRQRCRCRFPGFLLPNKQNSLLKPIALTAQRARDCHWRGRRRDSHWFGSSPIRSSLGLPAPAAQSAVPAHSNARFRAHTSHVACDDTERATPPLAPFEKANLTHPLDVPSSNLTA
jgi:hypothetical protein